MGRDLKCMSSITASSHFLIKHPSPCRVSQTMSQFRAKKLDLGCFVNIKTIRDHTKRKVFEQNEPERYAYTSQP